MNDHDDSRAAGDALDPRPLGETGQIYVTGRAALDAARTGVGIPPDSAYADLHEPPEQTRRELTEQLLSARQTHLAVQGRPEQWRRRVRSWGWDVTAGVVREGPLAVVVQVSVRPYRARRGGRGRS